jgi:hypothetical protein
VYAENVRTEELEAILRQLADEPKNKPAQQSTFESMVVTSLSPEQRQHLSGLLGVDATELEAPKRKSAGGLFDNTIIPKDNTKKTTPRPSPQSGRFAMVLANDAGRDGTVSAEVKEFLASRQQQRPETMQVLLVIRQA